MLHSVTYTSSQRNLWFSSVQKMIGGDQYKKSYPSKNLSESEHQYRYRTVEVLSLWVDIMSVSVYNSTSSIGTGKEISPYQYHVFANFSRSLQVPTFQFTLKTGTFYIDLYGSFLKGFAPLPTRTPFHSFLLSGIAPLKRCSIFFVLSFKFFWYLITFICIWI